VQATGDPSDDAPMTAYAAGDAAGLERYAALKAWRGEVARARNLPAYVVFHDATLAEMARAAPRSLEALAEIGGGGARKLEAYGDEILRVLDPDRARTEAAPD
jgi:ATP-dependent DNA helicase RecQ